MATMTEHGATLLKEHRLGDAEQIRQLEQKYKADRNYFKPLAEAYLAAGKPGKVIKLIGNQGALTKDPEVRFLLGCAYFDTFRNNEAKQILTSLGDRLHKNSAALRMLGELALEENKKENALSYLKEAYALDNKDRQTVELLRGLGENIAEISADSANAFHSIVPEKPERETLPSALLQVAIAALCCSALFGIYKWRADVAYEAASLVMQARPSAVAGDVPAVSYSIETYEKVLALDSKNDYALSGLSEAHAMLFFEHGMQAHRTRAEYYLKECRRRGIEKAETYMAEGLLGLADGRYKDVKQLASGLIKKGAQDERLLYLAGMSERMLGGLDVGLAELKKAVDISSRTPLYTLSLGDAYYLDGDERNARFYWEKAGVMNPGHPIAKARALIAATRQNKDATEIENGLSKVEKIAANLTAPKDQAAIALAWAELYLRENEFKKAEQKIDAALELYPTDPILMDARGRILIAAGEASRGMANLESALVIYPDSKRIILDIVDANIQAGNYEKALSNLKRLAAKEEGVSKEYHLKYGDILLKMALASGDKKPAYFDEAEGAYNRAITINSSYAEGYYSLGFLKQEQAKYQDAVGYYQKAAEIRERYPEVYRQMGIMYVKLGDIDTANQWFTDAENMFITNRRTAPNTMREFYKVTVDTFAAAGARAKKYEKIWSQKQAAYLKR